MIEKIDIIGNNTMIANSNKFLQLLCWDWIPAFAGMTPNENTGMILPGPVIPAKAGIQTNNPLFPIMSNVNWARFLSFQLDQKLG